MEGAYKELRKKKREERLTATKAKKMLKEGRANGQPLTKKQRGYFGAVAGGNAKK